MWSPYAAYKLDVPYTYKSWQSEPAINAFIAVPWLTLQYSDWRDTIRNTIPLMLIGVLRIKFVSLGFNVRLIVYTQNETKAYHGQTYIDSILREFAGNGFVLLNWLVEHNLG